MSNFFEALANRTPIKQVQHEYRLYYDKESGKPLFYSMEDKEGDYVVIDKQTYAESPSNIRVINGRIEKFVFRDISKLVPKGGTINCHSDDITVIVSENGTNWSRKQYEY